MFVALLWLSPVGLGGATSAWAAPADAARRALPDGVAWQTRVHGWAGGAWVVATPEVAGLPVLDQRAVVDVGPGDAVRRVQAGPVPPAGSPEPVLPADEAIARAREVAARLGRGQLWEPAATLAWQPVDDALVLAWAVHVSTAAPPAVWRVAVAADDGRVLRTRSQSQSASADVYPRSPLAGARETVELGHLDGGDTLVGTYATAASCVVAEVGSDLFGGADCASFEPLAIADDDGDFQFSDSPESFNDPLAEVQVYHHVDLIASWLDERYGFRHARPIDAFVNFEMANAFYGDFDGDGVGDVSFGQAEDGVDFAYDADVVYHEFGHSVVGAVAAVPGLSADEHGLEWAGGSLNEGAADVFAMLLTDDAGMGRYAGSAFGRRAIRHLADDRRCPDDLRGEVHRDGEILGAFAWNVMHDPRVPDGAMGDLLMGALPQWGPDVSWAAAGESLVVAADDLREVGALDATAHAAVLEHLAESGIAGCGRAIEVEVGVDYDMYIMKSGLGGDLARIPAGTQLAITVPPDAASVWIDVEAHDDVGWSLFGRVDVPIVHEPLVVDAFGIGTAVPQTWDWTLDGFGDGGARLGERGAVELVPGSTLYVSLTSWTGEALDLDSLFELQRVTVRARLSTAAESVEVPATACNTGGGTPGWLAVILLALVRRDRS